MDFHNDDYGNLHVSKPRDGDTVYLKNMERFYRLMKENTWFTGKIQNVFTDDPERFSIAAGLYQRYDITGCILELNGNRISNPDRIPSSNDWEQLGVKLYDVFIKYFETD
jgi:hypothetical protein